MGCRRSVVHRVGVVAGLSLAVSMPVRALECPAPHPLAGPGILNESPAKIHEVENLLVTGDDDNRIHVVVDDLRARYPGVQNAEMIDYLMAAYCPVVAQLSGIDEQDKHARMDRFVSQLSRIIY